MYVIDTSVLAPVFFENKHRKYFTDFLEKKFEEGKGLVCPDLIFYELSSVFLKHDFEDEYIHELIYYFEELIDDGYYQIISFNLATLKKAVQMANTDTKKSRSYFSV